MVFIKRSIAKLELTGEKEPAWLKDGETPKNNDVPVKAEVNSEEQDEKESD